MDTHRNRTPRMGDEKKVDRKVERAADEICNNSWSDGLYLSRIAHICDMFATHQVGRANFPPWRKVTKKKNIPWPTGNDRVQHIKISAREIIDHFLKVVYHEWRVCKSSSLRFGWRIRLAIYLVWLDCQIGRFQPKANSTRGQIDMNFHISISEKKKLPEFL